MSRDKYRVVLSAMLQELLLTQNSESLESYLVREGLPNAARMNLTLTQGFADALGDYIKRSKANSDHESSKAWGFLKQTLDGWSQLTTINAPVNSPRIILPCTAALTYGQIACVMPEEWQRMVTRLLLAAKDSRWRVREMVATALQWMLVCNWTRTVADLDSWAKEDNPLVIRAVVGAIAEPPLLKNTEQGLAALTLQKIAVDYLRNIPQSKRKTDEMQALIKALAFTLSVAIAAAPDDGFTYLESLAALTDKDIVWILQENLKKRRLYKWPNRVEKVKSLL
jgi:hypothetical protein